MGFPTWTLIGMGVSVLVALIAVGLSLLGQIPAAARRFGLGNARLDLRIRVNTGIGFACILLTIGFFVAGVPLGPVETEPAAAAAPTAEIAAVEPEDEVEPVATAAETPAATPTLPQVSSGAMGDTLPGSETEAAPDAGEPAGEVDPDATPTSPITVPTQTSTPDPDATATESFTPTPTPSPSNTPTPSPTPTSSPTPTASPTPTVTPTPTMTPTPVVGETASVDTNGSTLWVRRSPGGTPLVLVRDGDQVLLRDGNANQGGILWQEIATLDGFVGWVQSEFLTPN